MATAETCQLWVKSVQAGAIKTLVECLKEIVHDVNIIFDDQGARIVTMDGARCALIFMKLRAECFEEYKCVGKVRCGLNMASMHKLVKTCGSHDSIVLYNTTEATNELGIRICNTDKNSRTDFKLKLLDVDGMDISVPDVVFESVVTLPSTLFQRIARDMSSLADTMRIQCHRGVLTLSCVGEIASQETVIGEAANVLDVTTQCEEPVVGVYSLKYLTLFCKAAALCNVVELFLKKDYPLVLKFTMGLGELKFCLAPKTDD